MSRRNPSLKRATLFSVAGAVAYGSTLILLDVAIASAYGTGLQAAVYQAAYMFPTLLIGMLSGGAILGSFVPPFIRMRAAERHPDAIGFVQSSLAVVLGVTVLVALLLIFVAPLLARVAASGLDIAGRDDVTRTLRVMLLMLAPHGVAYVYSSALLSIGRVGFSNLAPVLIPVAGLATFPWWGLDRGAEMIGVGCVLGSFIMAVGLGLLLKGEGFSVAPRLRIQSHEWKPFLKSYIFSSFAYGALAAVLFANQAFAGSLSGGDIAAFGFGTKLVLLALAFFTTIVNSVALPKFTDMLTRYDKWEVWPRARTLIVRAFFIATVFTLTWIVLADWIVALVYARGQFSASDAKLVVGVQRMFLAQVPFYIVGLFCWRMLNSVGNWQSLLVASLPALAVDLVAANYLRWFYGASGIAGAHSLSIVLWAAILLICLRAQLIISQEPPPSSRSPSPGFRA